MAVLSQKQSPRLVWGPAQREGARAAPHNLPQLVHRGWARQGALGTHTCATEAGMNAHLGL